MSISIMKWLDTLFFEFFMIVVNKSLNNLPEKTAKWVSMHKFVNKSQTLNPFRLKKKGKSQTLNPFRWKSPLP
jgi:hypothetical protein